MAEETPEEIQASFVAELRTLAPGLRAWLQDLVARDGEEAALLRWATGLAGHPRVIESFRRHYFLVEAYNISVDEAFESPPPPAAELAWGLDDAGQAPPTVRHIDLLVSDLAEVAPDVWDLVEGLAFVPVGMDAEDEVV